MCNKRTQFENNIKLSALALASFVVVLTGVVVINDLVKDPIVVSADTKVYLRSEMRKPNIQFPKDQMPEPLKLKMTTDI